MLESHFSICGFSIIIYHLVQFHSIENEMQNATTKAGYFFTDYKKTELSVLSCMNKIYLPSHDPRSGWTIRHIFTTEPDILYIHRFTYPFYARFISIFGAGYQGIGIKEISLFGSGKRS